MIITYLALANEAELARDLQGGLEYSEVHILDIIHDSGELDDIQTVVSHDSFDHADDFWDDSSFPANNP